MIAISVAYNRSRISSLTLKLLFTTSLLDFQRKQELNVESKTAILLALPLGKTLKKFLHLVEVDRV